MLRQNHIICQCPESPFSSLCSHTPPPPPPNLLRFTPIQQSSTPADGPGSTTPDHGGGTPGEQTQAPRAASVCEWVTITPTPPPPTPPADRGGGTQSPKGIKEKWTYGSDSIAVDMATKGFGSIRFNICALFKSNVGFPSSHLTVNSPNTFEAHTMEIPWHQLLFKCLIVVHQLWS